MKTQSLITLFITCILIIGCDKSMEIIFCNNEDSHVIVESLNTKSDIKSQEYFVSKDEAKRLAGILKPKNDVLTLVPVTIEEDTLIWVINYDKGWIAISADKRAQPILGQDDDTQLDLKQDIIGPVVWVNSLAEEIKAMKASEEIFDNAYTEFWNSITAAKYKNVNSSVPTKSLDDYMWAIFWDGAYPYTLVTNQINHLVITKWGQKYPWNQELPYHGPNRCLTGCVAVAEGQLVYYYNNYFNMGLGLYHTVGCSVNSINSQTNNIGFYRNNYQSNSSRWSQMSVDSTDVINHYPEYVGDLMLDLGNRVNTYYSSNESGVMPNSISSIPSALGAYGLHCDDSTYTSIYPALSNLENSLPMMIRVNNDLSQMTHIWIIDGLREETMYIANQYHLEYTDDYEDAIAYYSDRDIEEIFGEYYYDGMEWEEISTDGVFKYFFMNWGYNGKYDNGKYSIVTNSSWRDYVNNKVLYFNFEELE